MKAIGGFFELELPQSGESYHPDACALSTGRACLGVILNELSPCKVYVPFYTCDATIQPFHLNSIPIEYYKINDQLEPDCIPSLSKGMYFLYTNYFGIKKAMVEQLAALYGNQLVLDNSHAFFEHPDSTVWSFTSARKSFGVPDGAYLYGPRSIEQSYNRFEKISITHSFERLAGNRQRAFEAYQEYEASLDCTIRRISYYSEKLLNGLDYEFAKEKRLANFEHLHQALAPFNALVLNKQKSEIPFCYPFLPPKPVLRAELYSEKLFIPTFWTDTLHRGIEGFETSKKLTQELLPLPIDHRYGSKDMERMIQFFKSKL